MRQGVYTLMVRWFSFKYVVFFLCLFGLYVACSDNIPSGLYVCGSHQDCQPPSLCISSVCVSLGNTSPSDGVNAQDAQEGADSDSPETTQSNDRMADVSSTSEQEPEGDIDTVVSPGEPDNRDTLQDAASPEDAGGLESKTTDGLSESLVQDTSGQDVANQELSENTMDGDDSAQPESSDQEGTQETVPTPESGQEATPEVPPESTCQVGIPCVLSNPQGTCNKGRQICQNGQPVCVEIQLQTILRLRGYAEGALSPCSPAVLRYPTHLAVGRNNHIYISDVSNHLIRKFSPDGKITTLAGDVGKSGDKDGVGTKAQFDKPRGMAIDSAGNVYVADSGNHTIRKIEPDGTVTTLAGKAGQTGLKDDTGDKARFNAPSGLTFDALGFLYVADAGNHAIRQIDKTGKVVTIAGGAQGFVDAQSTSAKFYVPTDLAFDANGNLFVVDQYNHSIRKISPSGLVSTFAGLNVVGYANGQGISARFYYPTALAVGPLGDIYVSDKYNHVIRHISAQGAVTLLAGTPSYGGYLNSFHTQSRFNRPHGLVFDAKGNLLVADQENHLIRRIEVKQVATVAGDVQGNSSTPKDGDALCARAEKPFRGTVDAKGTIYFTDFATHTIYQISPTGEVRFLAGTGQPGSLDGDTITATFFGPAGIVADRQGNLYVADTYNQRIRKIDTQGKVSTYAGSSGGFKDSPNPLLAQFSYPTGLVMDASGNLYVADRYNYRIRKISTQGEVTTFAGMGWAGAQDGTASAATFNQPVALAFDTQGQLVIADAANHRIRLIDKQNNVITLAGSTQGLLDGRGTGAKFSSPWDITLGPDGFLYVVDQGNHKIRKIDNLGNVSTVAGSTQGFLDDLPSAAKFYNPYGLLFDAQKNLLIFDTDNYAIRMLPSCPP